MIKPWTERVEARWLNNAWVFTHHRLYSVWLAKKVDSGRTLVYSMRFRQTQQGDGSWSPTEYYSVGTSYEILPENLNK